MDSNFFRFLRSIVLCLLLANANKFEHIRHVNTLLGLFVPIMAALYQLLYEEV